MTSSLHCSELVAGIKVHNLYVSAATLYRVLPALVESGLAAQSRGTDHDALRSTWQAGLGLT